MFDFDKVRDFGLSDWKVACEHQREVRTKTASAL